jgi:hypothetical protein
MYFFNIKKLITDLRQDKVSYLDKKLYLIGASITSIPALFAFYFLIDYAGLVSESGLIYVIIAELFFINMCYLVSSIGSKQIDFIKSFASLSFVISVMLLSLVLSYEVYLYIMYGHNSFIHILNKREFLKPSYVGCWYSEKAFILYGLVKCILVAIGISKLNNK